MNYLKKQLLTIEQKLTHCTSREKLLILIAVGVITYLVLEGLLLKPLSEKISIKRSLLSEQVQTLEAIEQERALKINSKKNQEVLLGQEIEEIKLKLNETRQSVHYDLSAKDMLLVLEAMVGMSKQVHFLGIKNSPSKPLNDSNVLFGHPLEMQLQGKFQDLVNFVRSLESLGLPMQLGAMSYQVQEYPIALLNIHLVLITQNKEFIEF